VVIGGLAVGAAIGTGLRKLFGEARAVRAEEAASQGGILLMRARNALAQELGRPLTASEVKQMFNAYVANLAALGFEQDAAGQWHRPRSAVERLLG
jgi:hypothetical protein